jgi:hypothetical protein
LECLSPQGFLQMRSLLIGLVAIIPTLVGPTISLAAQSGEMKSSYHYSGRVCRFGYDGNACIPDVSCGSEGGQCAESCVLSPERDYSARG